MRFTMLLAASALLACSSDTDAPPPPTGIGGAGAGGTTTSTGGGGHGGGGGQVAPCDAEGPAGCAYTPAHDLEGALQTVEFSLDSRVPGRSLNMLARWAPGDIGPRPVVMWSHGGSWNDNGHTSGASWSTTFARAGYVVVHTATVALDPAQLEGVCQQVGVTPPTDCDDWTLYPAFGLTDVVCADTATCLAACPWAPSGCECNVDQSRCVPVGDASPFSAIGAVRPWDVADVYAELGTVAANLETGAGIEVDVSKVLVGGWSGGSQAVLQGAGAERHLTDSVQSYAFEVEGPRAFIAVSPQGPGFSGFFEAPGDNSWDDIARPTLVLTGDGDEKDANDLTGPIRRQVYELMPPGDKHLFYNTNPDPQVVHGSYNLSGWDPNAPHPLDPLFAGLRSVALAFADHHLRGRADAAAYLASDAPARLAGGMADWVSK